MSKREYHPVPKEKIQLILELMNDPEIKELWTIYYNLPRAETEGQTRLIEARQKAFYNYSAARDRFLGLPPLYSLPLQTTSTNRGGLNNKF